MEPAADSAAFPDRHQAAAWPREAEEGLRLLAEHSRDVLYVADPDPLRVVYVNPAFEEIWGRTRESLENDPWAFLEGVHSEDRERVVARVPRWLHGVTTDEEYRILRPDGTVRWLSDHTIPVRDASGKVYRIVGIATDVTDRRRTEEILRLLDEASWLLSSSLDYTTTLTNLAHMIVPRLADICVVDVLEDGERIRRLEVAHADPEWDARLKELARRHPPRLVNPAHPLEKAIASGAPQLVPVVDDGFLALIEEDEERLRVLRELAPSSGMVVPLVARGRTLGALTLVISRSGRRFDAGDLAFASELARRAATAVDNAGLYQASLLANQAKADFLAMLSHELRTPMNAIIGFADLLEGGIGGAALVGPQLEQVARIKAGAWHVVNLVEGILSHTRIEAGRERVVAEPIELGQVVRESASMIEPAASEKGLRLRLDLPARPVHATSDSGKLKQILLNLLSNAVKFTPSGEIRVALREEAEALVVGVSDTGVGIQPEHVERVFDPFWRGDQPGTGRAGGTGLGLSVSRRLARLLGGEVTVESAPDVGSTFTVRLPPTVPTDPPD